MRLKRVLVHHIILAVNQPLHSNAEVFLYKLINFLLTKTCIMKTIYKKNPRRILGYLMAFAMVFFSLNINAQCLNTSSYGSATANASGAVTISTCNYLSEAVSYTHLTLPTTPYV